MSKRGNRSKRLLAVMLSAAMTVQYPLMQRHPQRSIGKTQS